MTEAGGHHLLEEAGVAEAFPAPGDRGVSVSTYGESPVWAPLQQLEQKVHANIAKLVEAGRSFEHHLVMGIGRYGVSQQPEATPVPPLPRVSTDSGSFTSGRP